MSASTFLTPVTGGRMSGQIVAQISDLIRQGKLTPGDRLPAERELVNTFGVSRVTVRDALRVLEVMGLVEIRVGSAGGAFVTTPSPDVIGETLSNLLVMRSFTPEQIAEVRLVIELGIFDLVVERITDEDLAELRQMCADSKQRLKSGEYDTHLSMEFHRRLAGAAHNPAITMLSESFSGPLAMTAMRAKEVRRNAHKKTVDEHTEIIEALAAGEADQARATLIAHLLRGRTAAIGTDRLLRRDVTTG